jgi:hypothetical protein
MERATWMRRADGVYVIVRRGRARRAGAAVLAMVGAFGLVGALSAAIAASMIVAPFAILAAIAVAAVLLRHARSRRLAAAPPVLLRAPAHVGAVVPFRAARIPAGAQPA